MLENCMKKVKKLNIVITGSSSGIGKSLKEHYKNQGHNVVGISLGDDDYIADVSNKEELSTAFKEIASRMDKIDILITCAGFGLSGAIELIDEKDIEREYAVNVLGTIYAIQSAMHNISQNGKIILISSACALFPLPFRAFYCSSKSAVSMLSDCLRMELSKTKIQSTAICPCDIKTNFTKNRRKDFKTNSRYLDAVRLSAERIDSREHKRMSLEKAIKIMTKIIDKKRLKPQYIMGFRNKFVYQVQKFFPKSFVLKILTKMFFVDK